MTDKRIRWPDATFGDIEVYLDGELVTNGLGQTAVRLKVDVGSSTVTITTGQADSDTFTATTTPVAPIAGVFDDDIADIPDGDAGGIRATKKRELYTAESASLTLGTAQQTSTGSAVAIAAAPARPTRRQVTVTNQDGTNSCWVGNTGVTSGTGVLLAKGASRVFRTKAALFVVDNNSNHVVIDVQDEYD